MKHKTTVLIADEAPSIRAAISKMLGEAGEFEVVAEVADGLAAVNEAVRLVPDVVLIQLNIPRLDGLEATRKIGRKVASNIIILSSDGDRESMRKAMSAGARDFLVKPFGTRELVEAMRNLVREETPVPGKESRDSRDSRRGKVITFFATKGGVGKSTLACNLAVSLGVQTNSRVALVDLDLEFGILSTLFGVRPKATIVDLCRLNEILDEETVRRVMVQTCGVPISLLPAPPSPDLAAEVDGEAKRHPDRNYVGEIIDSLRAKYRYVVIDTSTGFRDANLTTLDRSDLILLVTTPDIPSLKNTAVGLDILTEKLEYGRDKVKVVLNFSDAALTVSPEEIGHALDYPVSYSIPADSQTAGAAANSGRPFTGRRQRTVLGKALDEMARRLAGGVDGTDAQEAARSKRVSVFSFLVPFRSSLDTN